MLATSRRNVKPEKYATGVLTATGLADSVPGMDTPQTLQTLWGRDLAQFLRPLIISLREDDGIRLATDIADTIARYLGIWLVPSDIAAVIRDYEHDDEEVQP
jgi:hypothetical protein